MLVGKHTFLCLDLIPRGLVLGKMAATTTKWNLGVKPAVGEQSWEMERYQILMTFFEHLKLRYLRLVSFVSRNIFFPQTSPWFILWGMCVYVSISACIIKIFHVVAGDEKKRLSHKTFL